jgi:YbbR domain-containing protein
MRAAAAFVVRNWPLKLAAILLATALYAGIVVSQNARTWPGQVSIEAVNQPADAFILDVLPEVTGIRYLAPVDAANRLSSASFTATVDLASVDPRSGAPFASVPVVVTATDPRVQVVDYSPQRVQIRIDPLVDATVPVIVERGTLPDGLSASDAVTTPTEVTVTGPRTQVERVVSAVARVRVQPAGLDVNEDVDLVAVDGRSDPVSQVDLSPTTVHVRIDVSSSSTTRTVPVTPVVSGDPATGYEIVSAAADPALVTIQGDAGTLADITTISTRPVSVTGARDDVVKTVALDLPAGVTAGGATKAKVTVEVRERRGTRSLSAGIEIVGARDERAYELSVDRVAVTLGGSLAALDAIDAATFTASIDVSGLGEGSHVVRVAVQLPPGVTLVATNPALVGVTVTVHTPPPTPSPPPPAPTPTPTPIPTVEPSVVP